MSKELDSIINNVIGTNQPDKQTSQVRNTKPDAPQTGGLSTQTESVGALKTDGETPAIQQQQDAAQQVQDEALSIMMSLAAQGAVLDAVTIHQIRTTVFNSKLAELTNQELQRLLIQTAQKNLMAVNLLENEALLSNFMETNGLPTVQETKSQAEFIKGQDNSTYSPEDFFKGTPLPAGVTLQDISALTLATVKRYSKKQ